MTPWSRAQTEVDGRRYSLQVGPTSLPYVLRRYQRQRWYTVWAEWHKGLPTGARARAVRELTGLSWRSDVDPPGWALPGFTPAQTLAGLTVPACGA